MNSSFLQGAARWVACVLLACVVLSCGEGRPKQVLSKKRMTAVLYDYHLAQAYASTRGDSAAALDSAYLRSILKAHHATQAEFDSSMAWYSRHADQFYEVYTRVCDRYAQLSEQGATAGGARGVFATRQRTGDTANVWRAAQAAVLSPQGGANRFSFSLKADTAFHPSDRFLWHFHAHYIYQSGRKEAYALLRVRYANDSSTVRLQPIYGDGDYDVSVTAVRLPIRSVEGFIYQDERWTSDVKLLFLSDFSLIRMHAQPEARPATSLSSADSLRAVQAGEQALQADPNKRFIDSIQRTARPDVGTKGHFKEIDGSTPAHTNPLLERAGRARAKH